MRVDTVRPNGFFWRVLEATAKAEKRPTPDFTNQRLFTLDPGETTGCARLKYMPPNLGFGTEGDWLIELFQWETKDIGQSFDRLRIYLEEEVITHLRVEDYKVYEWKADDHSWAGLHTAQWIGAIKAAAHVADVPMSVKMAQHAKAFATDELLKKCGIYSPGLHHARDAERHLLYYMAYPNT
jgi:hypothetical protein